MKPSVIYYDFQTTKEVLSEPESPVVLTGSMLSKGRRLLKATAHANAAMHAACIFLCGACTAVGLLILVMLSCGI